MIRFLPGDRVAHPDGFPSQVEIKRLWQSA